LYIADIIVELRALEVPVIDRRAVEELFGVKRRQAVALMQRFGGYRSGNTMLADCAALIEQLEAIAASPEAQFEVRRKQKLSEKLARMRRDRAAARVRIPAATDAHQRRIRDLPAGVALEPTRFTVEFQGAEQLLSKLYEFSQAVNNDFELFCRLVEPQPDRTAPRP
jgi:hypothetical protein